MTALEILDDNVVFRRTKAGEQEVLSRARRLSHATQRFLTLVNGNTPLRVLLDLAFSSGHMHDEISYLVQEGLIEPVPTEVPIAQLRSAWTL